MHVDVPQRVIRAAVLRSTISIAMFLLAAAQIAIEMISGQNDQAGVDIIHRILDCL